MVRQRSERKNAFSAGRFGQRWLGGPDPCLPGGGHLVELSKDYAIASIAVRMVQRREKEF
jgi:hypothetical protein